MIWAKICGLREYSEAAAICALSPDAIGFNFYERSSRYVTPAEAREICQKLPDDVRKVGVFVDQTPEQIQHIASTVDLDTVQLHGDYTAADAAALKNWPLIWAYRMGTEGLAPLIKQLHELQQHGVTLLACLVDASVPGHYGGSGTPLDWHFLREQLAQFPIPRLILVGGLTAENITEAIQYVNPWGVDVASGVETKGRKDPIKCARFLRNLRDFRE